MKKNLLSSFQIRIFIGTFLAVFLISSLRYLGIHTPKLVIPIPSISPSILDQVTPYLESKKNTYHLKKEQSLVGKAYAAGEFDQATSYALINFDSGDIVYEKNADSRVPIASLTKLMTAVVALDLASKDEVFIVTKNASEQIPSKINILPGEKMTLEELLTASLMASANDATEEIRDGINEKYKVPVFIDAMNKKAEILGLKNSHFANPQGFDSPDHYSSANDLAILSHYALTNYPLIAQIVQKDYKVLPATRNHQEFKLNNWNGLLGVYPNVLGLKIGNTEMAHKTTAVLSERNGTKLLAVLLGAPGIKERDMWTAELLDTGFETFGTSKAHITSEALQQKYDSWYIPR